jgi:predicted Zn-dependent protease
MRKNLLILLAVGVITACVKVPITNRRQANLLPETTLIGMAKEQYTQFLSTAKVLPETDARAKRVLTIGRKIQKATEEFLTKKGHANRLKGFMWEFNTVDDKTINAWCMPGGLVVVYAGILQLVGNDDELAVIMGHEIAHAIARHGNERMSQQMMVNGMGKTLFPQDSSQVNVFQKVYMGTATMGMLKYGRGHETESDKLGLVFMKLAGYNPEAAISFWEKMAAQGGGNIPEIFSTHPSDERRIADIKEFLKEIDNYTK